MRTALHVSQGDITALEVDAIVNAADELLLGGGGVDGAIHRVAGPELLAECRRIEGCPTGQARITGAYNLPARYVIHTVGPIWRGGGDGEDGLLAGCYGSCLALARENAVASIAFPAISTGVYSFPVERAAQIAVGTVATELTRDPAGMEKVVFCTFGAAATAAYEAALAALEA